MKKEGFDLLEKLINVNSYTENKIGVDKVSTLICDFLKDTKPTIKIFKNSSKGNLFYLTWLDQKNKSEKKSKILLSGHSDTVFKENWSNFSYDKEKAYGPGVLDMKGGLVVMASVVKYFHRKGLLGNLGLVLVPDEETGSQNFKKELREIYKQYEFGMVFEPGPFREDWRFQREIVIARKGITKIVANYRGLGGHAATEIEKRYSCSEVVARKTLEIHGLTNADKGVLTNVGILESGTTFNSISPVAKMVIDLRNNSTESQEEYLKKIKRILEKPVFGTVNVNVDISIKIAPFFDENNEMNRLIEYLNEKEKEFNLIGVDRSGVSDANQMSAVGVKVLDGLGPVGDGDHSEKEFIFKDSLNQSIEISKELIRQILLR